MRKLQDRNSKEEKKWKNRGQRRMRKRGLHVRHVKRKLKQEEPNRGRGRPPLSVPPSRFSKCGWKPSVQSTSLVRDSYTPQTIEKDSCLKKKKSCRSLEKDISMFAERHCDKGRNHSVKLRCAQQTRKSVPEPNIIQNMFVVFLKQL